VSILDLTHGIHLRVPEQTYHQRIIGVASKGALDRIRRSPAHYRSWVAGHDEVASPALDFGKMFHCALLERDVFESTHVVEPDFGDQRYKENKAKKADWKTANEGKNPVDQKDFAAALGMAEAIRRHPKAGALLIGGDAEVTVRWQDEGTGIECKSRLDYYLPELGYVVDVKTTDDASEDGFQRSVAKYGYHRQAAFYEEGLATIGMPIEGFVFVAVEKEPPYGVGVYLLDDDGIRRGRDSIRSNLIRLAACIEHDTWPAYSDSIVTLSLPAWAA